MKTEKKIRRNNNSEIIFRIKYIAMAAEEVVCVLTDKLRINSKVNES